MSGWRLLDTSQMNPEPIAPIAAGPAALTTYPNLVGFSQFASPELGPMQPNTKQVRTLEQKSLKETQGLRPDSPEEFMALLQSAGQSPVIQEQEEQLALLKELAKQRAGQPVQVDLTPLMALAESESKGFRSGYKAPESAQDRMDAIFKYNAEVEKRTGDLNRSLLDAVKAHYLGKNQNRTVINLGATRQDTVADPNLYRRGGGNPAVNADRYIKTFRSDPTVKGALETANGARDVLTNLESPNWLSDVAIRTNLTKAAHLTPVSDLDIKQFSGSPDLQNRLIKFQGKLLAGESYTESDRDIIRQYALLQQRKSRQLLEESADSYAENVGVPDYGYDYDTGIGKLSSVVSGLKPKGKRTAEKDTIPMQQAAPQGEKPLEEMSAEELKAWIKQNGG